MSKITFISAAHPYRGGIASFNEMLARELISEGEEVDIVTFTLQYPSFLFPGKSQYTSAPAPKDLKIRRAINSINPFNWLKVGRQIRDSKPDILFIRYWSPYLAPALATIAYQVRKNKHTRVITLADNIIPHERHFYDSPLTKYFIGCTDRFIVMSKEVERDLRTFTASIPVDFHHHPIYENYGDVISKEEACQRLGLSAEGEYALFFGLIRDYKGLDMLLDAWALFTADKPEKYTLLVAGEYYNDKSQYLEQIARLGLESKVVIVDKFIADEDVKSYFCASSVVAQPYKSATQSGITQIAYNFSTPMIVTRVGGLPEIVKDGKVGYVVELNPESVAEALAKCFDGENNKRLRGNFDDEKKKFSWTSFADLVLKC